VTLARAAVAVEDVHRALEAVVDPELALPVTALGLIYGIAIDGARVRVTMTLTAPGCPLHDVMTDAVREAVRALPGVDDVEVVVTFDPPWSPDRMRV
jgi:metal-sulfur cluster biosynthetic enzyme